jgi:hypothetical protein
MINRTYIQMTLATALAAHLAVAGAVPAAIGIAVKNGNFRVDSARVQGNTTLFDGNVVESEQSLARLYLASGARVRLAAQSRARVHAGRLVLETGAAGFTGSPYQIEALALRVETEGPEAAARVRLAGPGKVQVAAEKGRVQVRNQHGVLLARVAEGVALEFTAAAAEPTALRVSGVLRKVQGRYLVEDSLTGVTFELRGKGLEAAVGRKVAATGASVTGTDNVLEVRTMEVGPQTAHKVAPPARATALWGMSTATTALLFGIGIAVAGATAAVALSDGDDEVPATSPVR